MKKEHTLIMLQSEKASHLRLLKNSGVLQFNSQSFKSLESLGYNQHLYILSDEEIKEGDWFIHTYTNRIHQCIGWRGTDLLIVGVIGNTNSYPTPNQYIKKIVATTNPDLWYKYSIGHLPQEPLIPKISLDFVERYIKEYNKGNKIEKVMLEYEEPSKILKFGKEWCLDCDESQDICQCKYGLKLRSNGSVIISPVEEKKYTREEIEEAFKAGASGQIGFNEYFESNFPE